MRGIGRIRRYIRNWRYARIHAAHHKLFADEYLDIDDIITRYRAGGGLSHPFQAYKLYSLRNLLDERRPKSILELGSGTTTAVFAEYARSSGAELTVVDEDANWLAHSKKLAGDPKNANFVSAEKEEEPNFGTTRYKTLPNGRYDFVLVDGPTLSIGGVGDKSIVNSNVFELIESHPPEFIIVDIRKATAEALRARPEYDAKMSDVLGENIHTNYRYFSEFIRKSS